MAEAPVVPAEVAPPAGDPKPPEKDGDFGGPLQELPIAKIREGRNARVLQSAPEQKALTDSVRTHGVLQPIRVRPMSDGTFEVIAGHRRFSAAKSAHLKAVPAVVAVTDETTAFVQSLVENLQREDLNPLDEARALKALIAETGQTQEDVGKLISRSQAYVSNSMRLLELAEPVQTAIETGKLSASHGKALASLPVENQVKVAQDAIDKKLPSREVEDRIRREREEAQRVAETKARKEAEAVSAKEKLTAFLTEKKLKPAQVTVISERYGTDHVIAAFAEVGVTARSGAAADREKPEWTCDEQKVTFTYQPWSGTFNPTCTEQAHKDEFVKARDKEKQKAAAKIAARLERAKTATSKALRLDEGKGALNLDGQRVALFVLLTSHRGYSYNGVDRGARFVKRHGGLPEGVNEAQAIDILETIDGLSEKDLGTELVAAMLDSVFVNVWSTAPTDGEWPLRRYLVEKVKGLDPELVFGDKPTPTSVLEALRKRGKALAAEDVARLEKVDAERAEFMARVPSAAGPYAKPATVNDEPDDESDDDEAEGDIDAGDVEEK